LLYVAPTGTTTLDEEGRKLLSAHIILWPLMATSAIIVKHREAPFKPEYIVPQMLLQWVRRTDGVDGVCYFSTHVNGVSKSHPLQACNLAFPAKEVKPAGRCPHLRGAFKMTAPIGWELIRAIQVTKNLAALSGQRHHVEFVDGIEEAYWATEFGTVEIKLDHLAYRIINANKQGEPDLGDVKE
jgi:hypothetical protein